MAEQVTDPPLTLGDLRDRFHERYLKELLVWFPRLMDLEKKESDYYKRFPEGVETVWDINAAPLIRIAFKQHETMRALLEREGAQAVYDVVETTAQIIPKRGEWPFDGHFLYRARSLAGIHVLTFYAADTSVGSGLRSQLKDLPPSPLIFQLLPERRRPGNPEWIAKAGPSVDDVLKAAAEMAAGEDAAEKYGSSRAGARYPTPLLKALGERFGVHRRTIEKRLTAGHYRTPPHLLKQVRRRPTRKK